MLAEPGRVCVPRPPATSAVLPPFARDLMSVPDAGGTCAATRGCFERYDRNMAIIVTVALLVFGMGAAFVSFRLLRTANTRTLQIASVAVPVFAVFAVLATASLPAALESPSLSDQEGFDGFGGTNPPVRRPPQAVSNEAGWGPDRRLYTNSLPAVLPALNSITDNPRVGDERNFAVFKNVKIEEDGHWMTSGNMEAGQRYLFRIYVNNAAADELESATLRDVNVQLEIPPTIGGDPSRRSAGVSRYCATVASTNAAPREVFNCGVLTATEGVRLFPDISSTKLYNNVFGRPGLRLGPAILTSSGQVIGFDKMDGVIRAGYRYACYIYIEVQVERL